MDLSTIARSSFRDDEYERVIHDIGAETGIDLGSVHRFDAELRHAIRTLLEFVELALRGRLDRMCTVTAGTRWHLRHDAYRRDTDVAALHMRMERELRRSLDPTIRTIPPQSRLRSVAFGALAEELSLGTLSRVSGALPPPEQRQLADSFTIPQQTLRGTLQFLTHVRNVCAHHGRLVGRRLAVASPTYRSPPALASTVVAAHSRSVFVAVVVSAHLARSVPGTESALDAAAQTLVADSQLSRLVGVPTHWDGHLP